MTNDSLSYLLGRAVSWLRALSLDPEINNEVKESLTRLIENVTVGDGDRLWFFGQTVSWLQVLSAKLPAEDKAKVVKLLFDIDKAMENFK